MGPIGTHDSPRRIGDLCQIRAHPPVDWIHYMHGTQTETLEDEDEG
jgi:hypothetical protein